MEDGWPASVTAGRWGAPGSPAGNRSPHPGPLPEGEGECADEHLWRNSESSCGRSGERNHRGHSATFGRNQIDPADFSERCASKRISVRFCVSLCASRAFSDLLINAGGDMESKNHPGVTTQATGTKVEAATARGSQ